MVTRPVAVSFSLFCLLLGLVWSVLELHGPLTAAPAPDRPQKRLSNPVAINVPGLEIIGAALLKDNESVIVVGGSPLNPDDKDLPPWDYPPGGAIVNLRTKAIRPFTNGHKYRISNAACSADGSRVYTAGCANDPFLRVWDVKTGKSLEPIPLMKGEGGSLPWYGIACFTRRPVVAVSHEKIFTFDLKRPQDKADFPIEASEDDYLCGLAISPDDQFLGAGGDKVVIWDVPSRKVVYTPKLVPEGSNGAKWFFQSLTFTKDGTQLLVVRRGTLTKLIEVPEGKPEEKVPAQDRGVFQIDLRKKEVVPLGMGHQLHTRRVALHPSETWVATVGTSRPDVPKKDGKPNIVGELRVYHYPTRTLAHRLPFGDGFFPDWVSFTPDGKRLVVYDISAGEVRAWDFAANKP